jgi:hypothetical protein
VAGIAERSRRGFAAAPVLGDRRFQDVVHGHHAQHPVGVVDDGNGVEVVVGHQQRDVGHVGIGCHPHRIGVHDDGDGDGGVGLQQPDH